MGHAADFAELWQLYLQWGHLRPWWREPSTSYGKSSRGEVPYAVPSLQLHIIGSYHVKGLAEVFRVAEDEVNTEDAYDGGWYRGIPLESDGEILGFYKERHGRAHRR